MAELKLAVTEACTNAILHGYSGSTEGELVVRYRVDTAAIEVEVEDDGDGFDPDDPAAGSNGEGQGMGLMIIRAITNDVQIESDAIRVAHLASSDGSRSDRQSLSRAVAVAREMTDRLLGRRIDLEDPVEQGDLEDLADVRVVAGDRELAAGGPQALDRAHQHAERRRIDEGRMREVDEHAARAALDRLEQRLLERGRRRKIDLAGDGNRGDTAPRSAVDSWSSIRRMPSLPRTPARQTRRYPESA